MKAVIYTRVSSDEQVKGTSLDRQDEMCRDYCRERRLEVVAAFREEGESAKSLRLNNRKLFLAALEYCRKHRGQIDAFVVLRVDRFARNTEDHFHVRRILRGYGTALHSVTEPIGDKPAEKFIETVLAGAADYDNAIRKQRCTDGMAARISQGIWPFRPPIGYVAQGSKKRGEKKTTADPIDVRCFATLRRALRAYAAGTIATQKDLTGVLTAWRFEQACGVRPTLQFVDRITSDFLPFYAGVVTNPWTRETFPGQHEPMISEAEMYLIRQRRSGRTWTRTRDRQNALFPLRKTVLCAGCMKRITGSRSRGKAGGIYSYYHCLHRGCAYYRKGIPKAQLENDMCAYLKRLIPKQEYWTLLTSAVAQVWQQRDALRRTRAAEWERREKTLLSRRARIYELREEGTYDRNVFIERLDAINLELATLRSARDAYTAQRLTLTQISEAVERLASDLNAALDEVGALTQSRFQRFVFPQGIPFDPKSGYRTPQLPLIFALENHFCDAQSRKVNLTVTNANLLFAELEELVRLNDAPAEADKIGHHAA